MIVFIGCVKKKKNYKTTAENLYDSTYFKYCLSYAKKLKPNNIFILSAKYGAITLDTIIEPYDKTLKNMTVEEFKKWKDIVLKQLKEYQINFNETAVFLCGKKYRKYIEPLFSNSVAPLEKYGGIGNQLHFLKNCDETTI